MRKAPKIVFASPYPARRTNDNQRFQCGIRTSTNNEFKKLAALQCTYDDALNVADVSENGAAAGLSKQVAIAQGFRTPQHASTVTSISRYDNAQLLRLRATKSSGPVSAPGGRFRATPVANAVSAFSKLPKRNLTVRLSGTLLVNSFSR